MLRNYELSKDVTRERNESFWYDLRDYYPIELYNINVYVLGIEYKSNDIGNDIMNATLGLKKGKCFQLNVDAHNVDIETLDELVKTHLDAVYVEL